MTKLRNREPQAPTPLDELISVQSLRSSPWVMRRIRELKLEGRLVKGWTPPVVPAFRSDLTRMTECSP